MKNLKEKNCGSEFYPSLHDAVGPQRLGHTAKHAHAHEKLYEMGWDDEDPSGQREVLFNTQTPL